MSNTRLADLRPCIASFDQADSALQRYALIEAALNVKAARLNKRIAEAKAAFVEDSADLVAEKESLSAQISSFITDHRDAFVKPRTRKTQFGEYGLRTVSEVVIEDEDALVDLLMDRGYVECVEVLHKLQRPAIKKRLEAGESLTGARVNTGDTGVLKVAQSVIAAARASAGIDDE